MGETPKLGLFAVNMRPAVEPEPVAWLGRLAEELGYESLWAGEHVVLPDPQRPPSPAPPTEPILDPLVTLTFLAAGTTKLRLGTGIIVLPERNPRCPGERAGKPRCPLRWASPVWDGRGLP